MSHKIGVGTVVQKRTRIHPIIYYPVGGAIGIGFTLYWQQNSQDHDVIAILKSEFYKTRILISKCASGHVTPLMDGSLSHSKINLSKQ